MASKTNSNTKALRMFKLTIGQRVFLVASYILIQSVYELKNAFRKTIHAVCDIILPGLFRQREVVNTPMSDV